MKKFLKPLLIIIGIIIVVLIAFFVRKFVIINTMLEAEASNASITNYHMKYTNNSTPMELYCSLEKLLYITTYDEGTVQILYDCTTSTVTIADNRVQQVSLYPFEDSEIGSGYTDVLTPYISASFLDKLKYAFQWEVGTETISDTECYYAKYEGKDESWAIWLDKDTMLIKAESSAYADNDITNTYEVNLIEIDTVTDSDFTITGTESYEYIYN